MSLLQVPEWEQFDWLIHGFGTRLSEGWTHGESRTWVKQTHSAIVIDAASPGFQGEGDALVSAIPGVLLEVRTADCFPVLLIDPRRRAVAAIHAGWRGVAHEIVPKTIARLSELYGSRAEDLQAAIGPGIAKCCFEVGPEVAEEFGISGRTCIDLAARLQKQLRQEGIASGRIFEADGCTKCDAARFHSYRRDRDSAGRMASAAGIRA